MVNWRNKVSKISDVKAMALFRSDVGEDDEVKVEETKIFLGGER